MKRSIKRGQYTNKGWVVDTWSHDGSPPSGPDTGLVLCMETYETWDWYWEKDVIPVSSPGKIPILRKPAGSKTRLVKALAPYGGNTWVSKQAGVTRAYTARVLGNRLWPAPALVAKRKTAGWTNQQLCDYFGISAGVLHRCLLAAERGHTVYNGKRVTALPGYLMRKGVRP